MSRQIQIAQSEADETEVIELLSSKYDVLCFPRIMSAEELKAGPQVLGSCTRNEQVLFLRAFATFVLDSTLPLMSQPSAFHVVPEDDVCIEWTRSVRRKGNEFEAGRYYFATTRLNCPASARELGKLMTFLMSWIKETYPKASPGRIPIHVGPHLSRLLDSGRARLLYPNGTTVPLEIVSKS